MESSCLSLDAVSVKIHPDRPVIVYYIFLGLIPFSKYVCGYYKGQLLFQRDI